MCTVLYCCHRVTTQLQLINISYIRLAGQVARILEVENAPYRLVRILQGNKLHTVRKREFDDNIKAIWCVCVCVHVCVSGIMWFRIGTMGTLLETRL